MHEDFPEDVDVVDDIESSRNISPSLYECSSYPGESGEDDHEFQVHFVHHGKKEGKTRFCCYTFAIVLQSILSLKFQVQNFQIFFKKWDEISQ